MTPIEEVRSLLAAAARAYFATFNAVVAIAHRQGFIPKSSGDDHRDLIAFLKRSRNSLLKRVGFSRLPRLRAIRNRADYDQGQPFPRGLAEEAATTADETIGWIDSLNP